MSFDESFAVVLKIEGGYSDDPNDRGGKTMHGITEAVARDFGYTGAMPDLPLSLAKRIAKIKYWDVLRLDDIAPLSEPVARELFDTSYNMGHGRAGRFLQRVLNVLNQGTVDYPDLEVDGAVGTSTIDAFKKFILKRGSMGETVLLRALNAQQGCRYMEIAEANSTQENFIFGWFANRVT